MFRPASKNVIDLLPVSLTHRELQPQHQQIEPTALTLAHFEKSALEFAPGVTDILYQHSDNKLFVLVPTPVPSNYAFVAEPTDAPVTTPLLTLAPKPRRTDLLTNNRLTQNLPGNTPQDNF